MILKINGVLQESAGDFWGPIQDFTDKVTQGGSDFIVNPILHTIGGFIGNLNQEFVTILPELTVLIAVIFVGIGMFTNFGKWLSRGVVVYFGGAVWIILSKAAG